MGGLHEIGSRPEVSTKSGRAPSAFPRKHGCAPRTRPVLRRITEACHARGRRFRGSTRATHAVGILVRTRMRAHARGRCCAETRRRARHEVGVARNHGCVGSTRRAAPVDSHGTHPSPRPVLWVTRTLGARATDSGCLDHERIVATLWDWCDPLEGDTERARVRIPGSGRGGRRKSPPWIEGVHELERGWIADVRYSDMRKSRRTWRTRRARNQCIRLRMQDQEELARGDVEDV